MAGIIGIYGLVVSVLIANDLKQQLPLYTGFIQLGAGLAVGLSGLAAGYVFIRSAPCQNQPLLLRPHLPSYRVQADEFICVV